MEFNKGVNGSYMAVKSEEWRMDMGIVGRKGDSFLLTWPAVCHSHPKLGRNSCILQEFS